MRKSSLLVSENIWNRSDMGPELWRLIKQFEDCGSRCRLLAVKL